MSPFRETEPTEPPDIDRNELEREIDTLLINRDDIGSFGAALENSPLLNFTPDFDLVLDYIDGTSGQVKDQEALSREPLRTIFHILCWIERSNRNCNASVDKFFQTGTVDVVMNRLGILSQEYQDNPHSA